MASTDNLDRIVDPCSVCPQRHSCEKFSCNKYDEYIAELSRRGQYSDSPLMKSDRLIDLFKSPYFFILPF